MSGDMGCWPAIKINKKKAWSATTIHEYTHVSDQELLCPCGGVQEDQRELKVVGLCLNSIRIKMSKCEWEPDLSWQMHEMG